MRRTQVYLDEDQKKALRTLAADCDSTVSDLIRKAVDRLISDEFARGDMSARLRAWQEKVRQRYGDVPEDRVDAALQAVRRRTKPKTS